MKKVEDFSPLGEPWLSGVRNFFVAYKRRFRRWAGLAGAAITLSNSSTTTTAVNGDTIGTLAVVGGSGTFTFSFTYNPGTLFSITGSLLKVAGAPLVAGDDIIVVQADNGAGTVLLQAFIIRVISGTYVPTYELLGF